MISSRKFTDQIKRCAAELGFSKIGVTPAESLPDEAQHLSDWLSRGYQADMDWIRKRQRERTEIREYFPEVQSVICVAVNYFTGNARDDAETGRFSNYAWGSDYHDCIKDRLYQLLQNIRTQHSNVKYRICVDTSPVLERTWARRAGLGWIGKNTMLITKEFGSWVFLGELMLDIPLVYDEPFKTDHCGTCRKCLDACPTLALTQPYQLDAGRCLSYLTIEHRGDFLAEHPDDFHNWIYGCDICQEVCPWNQKIRVKSDWEEFEPRDNIHERSLESWLTLTSDEFRTLFRKSAVKRTRYTGLMRNIRYVSGIQ